MTRLVISAVVYLCGTATLLLAQPLYLGEQEIDTADRETLATIVRHCDGLTASRADSLIDAETAQIPPDGNEPELPLVEQAFASVIDLEALASSDDGAEAAGDGSGSGVPTSGNDDPSSGSAAVLEEISFEMCKEAGIVY